MPNLDFEVIESPRGSGGQTITARMKAVNEELRGVIRALVLRAIKEGQDVARREAPKGLTPRNDGRSIADSVQISEIRYSPGGVGGGGFYEADMYATGLIAPHLKYVFEGTMQEGTGLIGPKNAIRPGKGNLGGVLAIEKEGEGVHFRRWARGQKPQQAWWDLGREAVEETLEAGIHAIR